MTPDDITVVLRVLRAVESGQMRLTEAVPILTDLVDPPAPCPHCGEYPETEDSE
jgi:hypothetical protein